MGDAGKEEEGLRRQLSAGQMAMTAVGCSIGTGLLLGSAGALDIAGPAVILSYGLAAIINWTVTMALGELCSVHPAAGSFGLYGELYLNDWAGFLARAGYWAAIAISVGAEMVAAATYMGYWYPGVSALFWVALFSALLLLINLRSVGDYGRFEYWFAMIKLATILLFIVLGAGLLLSGRVASQYTANGGFLPNGPLAPVLAMFFALYAFGGVELVAISSGESRSVEEIPRAIRMTFLLLTVVYLGAIIVLVGVMPWNRAGVMESPFVTVFRTIRIPAAPHIMNFVVLTAALSGSNAALYAASRLLFSMARSGWAPAPLGRLNKAGSPKLALLASSFGIVVALVLQKWAPQNAVVYILSAAFFGLMLSWLVSLAAHVAFRRGLAAGQVAKLPMRSPAGAWGSVLGFILVFGSVAASWMRSRVAFISSLAYLVLLTLAYWMMKKKHRESTMTP